MDFELIAPKISENLLGKNYINDCCVGGDEILNQLKNEIALEMKFDENSIEIYQEDWGWALEFSKDKTFYLLAISNASGSETSQSIFTAYTQASKKEKALFFDKTVNADDELGSFSEIVLKTAKKSGFIVNKNEV